MKWQEELGDFGDDMYGLLQMTCPCDERNRFELFDESIKLCDWFSEHPDIAPHSSFCVRHFGLASAFMVGVNYAAEVEQTMDDVELGFVDWPDDDTEVETISLAHWLMANPRSRAAHWLSEGLESSAPLIQPLINGIFNIYII